MSDKNVNDNAPDVEDVEDVEYDSEEEYVDRANKRTVNDRVAHFSKFCKKGKMSEFSQSRYDKWDAPAKNTTKEKLGDFIKDNPEITMQDFIITDEEFKYKYLEVQIKTNWTDDAKYPDDYITLYPRKLKYDTDTLFITYNKDTTSGYIFSLKGLKIVMHRKKKYSRDIVYFLPWHRAIFFKSSNLSPKLIKKLFPSF